MRQGSKFCWGYTFHHMGAEYSLSFVIGCNRLLQNKCTLIEVQQLINTKYLLTVIYFNKLISSGYLQSHAGWKNRI